MRKIDTIILHCADTEEGQDFTVFDIDRWHKQRGWICVGYHYVIRLDGTVEHGRPEEAVGAHCLHQNHNSLGICYIGGRRNGHFTDTRTPAQLASMEKLVKQLLQKYPDARVCGHHDFNAEKACPCFDARAWARSAGIAEKNILP